MFALVSVLLIAVLAFYPFFNQTEQAVPLTGLPWQVEIMADGTTQIFGLNIGHTRLADAAKFLGDDMEVAVIAAADETGRLEMYFRSYRVGLLSGKIILKTSASEQDIESWRGNATKSDYVATGRAKKYVLSASDLDTAVNEVITGITFIPSVNLDEKIILARFGTPDKREKLAGALHFVYLKKGLDIVLYENAKEVLQYSIPQTAL